MKLLLVYSDQEFIDNFIYSFKSEEYEIFSANTIKEALFSIQKNEYDLVIMDMVFKDGTGLDLKRKMNEIINIPTIVVSNNKEPNEIVLALEYGCDDYIIKPFYLLELKARIRSVLRRSRANKTETIKIVKEADNSMAKDKFKFNILGRKVTVDDLELDLTGKEFDLLFILVSNKGKVFSRKELAASLWKDIEESNIRTVDVHIRRLREKLESTQTDRYIQTKWGEGYFYSDEMDS
ncbi:response regulator transcription factor [Helcococcus ovis]|uniref:response regulator transcription factor n=1 Tax=Helcococcus TaxID=31983 RepID=UPI001FD6CAF5|nr:response regulator transcription factor [Helcococcus ovis]WNZ00988.1 response regulator transcription factor [Helcococcus ovis]